jgi:hypothetical protein
MLNLFVDPGITGANFNPFGSGISASDGLIDFAGASYPNAIAFDGSAEADFFDRIAASGQYSVSVHVANHVRGTIRARIGGGPFADLMVGGDGWSLPVVVQAGSSRTTSLALQATDTQLQIVPDGTGEAIRITT